MLALLLGCLDHELAPGTAASFVAMQSDFAGYAGWTSYPVSGADSGGHGAGDRTVYVNQAPVDGGFAVGTILLKLTPTGAEPEVHAMAKRGSGFNTDGAVGWEWFDLVLDEDGVPVIDWRGTAPPSGEGYGSQSGDTGSIGDCNDCHAAARDNDFVFTLEL